ncbi:MAG: hypothetical protein RLN90_11655 [Balneolaceae bacterium]
MNLFKEDNLSNPGSRYSKSIEVRAIIIYSDDNKYKYFSKKLPNGEGVANASIKPKARSHFYLVNSGVYKAIDYKNGGFVDIEIEHSSVAIHNGFNFRIFTWKNDAFFEILIYDSMM